MTLLSSVPLYSSYDPEHVEQKLVQLHGIRHFDVIGDRAAFVATAGFIQLPRVALSYCAYGTPVRIEFPEADYVRQQFVLRGDGLVRVDGTATPVNPSRSFITRAETPACFDYCGDFEQLVVTVKTEALLKQLQHLVGPIPKTFPRFEGTVNLRLPERRRFQRLVSFVAQELSVGNNPPPKSLLLEYEDALVTTFLISNAGDFAGLFDREAKAISPWQVRATEEFIEANWQQPITIEMLSETIGASARSIFHAFKDARGYSPMVFLKRVRLNQARARLEAPDEGASVTAVGLACGFHNLSHFAKDYLQEFGEMPSETLKRGRGR